MGADLMRWIYCRHPPASNINFGPGPADELRNKFIIKIWNTYSFFCTYARLPREKGGFDLAAPPIPVKDRPDIDRWIISDLQLLIRTAHREFPRYNVMGFCLEAERFVDDKLSNWYVRRNKDRFWRSGQDADKLAAFQTLHTVLLTLARLFAPIMPFLTETMYRNLTDGPDDRSVHLGDYPQADETLIDEALSAEMDALLEIVSLGLSARNSVKIKVRQPLAEIKVMPASDSERRAVDRFPGLLALELNVKKVTLHDPAAGPLLRQEVRPNLKTLGPKLGPRLKEVQQVLTAVTSKDLDRLRSGESIVLSCPGGSVILDPGDVLIQWLAPDQWAGAEDRGRQVLLDCRLTDELKREGQAREVVRHVNDTRKKAALEMDDRIALYLSTESAPLRQAIDAEQVYIREETLAAEWATCPIDGDAYKTTVKIDGQPLVIELRKVEAVQLGG
jgi:isoleucyl-tRNA synthetase